MKVVLPLLIQNNQGNQGSSKNEALDAVLTYVKDQDESRRREDENRMKDLERLLSTKEKEEMTEKIERLREEQQKDKEMQNEVLDTRLEALQVAILNLGKGEDPISRQIEMKLKEKLTTAMVGAVNDFEISNKKQQLTDPNGKINTQEIIKQTFDTIGKGLDAWKSRGPPQPVMEMPIPSGATMPGVGDSIRIAPQQVQTMPSAAELGQQIQAATAATEQMIEPPAAEPITQAVEPSTPQVIASVEPVDRLAEKIAKKRARVKGEEV